LIKTIFRLKHLLVLISLFFNSGCFVTTHSYNHGKLLDPGERLITTGFGCKYSARFLKQERDFNTGVENPYLNEPIEENWEYYDSTRFGWLNLALSYRVGVLRKYPFGKGLETGFLVETAIRGRQEIDYNNEKSTSIEFFSPPLLEIDTRFGLPDITIKKGIFHHNLNWGWIIGQWIDNGWFFGYAAGVNLEHAIVYSSFRYFITGTDKFGEYNEDDFFRRHDRTHGIRLQFGSSFKLRLNESILPEYITPEFSLMFPNFNKVQPVGFSFSVGISWKPGF
jgi:hypothetical protein